MANWERREALHVAEVARQRMAGTPLTQEHRQAVEDIARSAERASKTILTSGTQLLSLRDKLCEICRCEGLNVCERAGGCTRDCTLADVSFGSWAALPRTALFQAASLVRTRTPTP